MSEDVEFTPVDTGNMAEIPPEAPEGAWEARCKVKRHIGKENGRPSLILEFKTTATLTEENKGYKGVTLTCFLNFPPKGDPKERREKLKVRTMCQAFGIASPDSSSLAVGNWESLEPFIAALEEGTWTVYSRHYRKNTGEVGVDVSFTPPKVKI